MFRLFSKRTHSTKNAAQSKDRGSRRTFDLNQYTPVIRSSICTGEKSAGFRENGSGQFHEVMVLRDPRDLEEFRRIYGVSGEIRTIY